MRNDKKLQLSLLTGSLLVIVCLGCQPPTSSHNTSPTAQPPRPLPQRLEDVPYEPLDALWPNSNQWGESGFDDLKLTAAPPPRQIIHRVRPGETLSSIARLHYNDPTAWKRIYAANRNLLSTPDRLLAGMTLVIPDKQSN